MNENLEQYLRKKGMTDEMLDQVEIMSFDEFRRGIEQVVKSYQDLINENIQVYSEIIDYRKTNHLIFYKAGDIFGYYNNGKKQTGFRQE